MYCCVTPVRHVAGRLEECTAISRARMSRRRNFGKLAHKELKRYPSLRFVPKEVTRARRRRDGSFSVRVGGRSETCRKLLVATGVFDQLPKLEGIDAFFGTSVFQCPYCDGWEVRNKPIAVYGKYRRGFEIARAMTAWTDDVLLCTDGHSRLSPEARVALRRNGIALMEEPIARLEGRGAHLRRVVFRNGRKVPRSALFFRHAFQRAIPPCGIARLPVHP